MHRIVEKLSWIFHQDQVRSNVTVLLTVLFHCNGSCHKVVRSIGNTTLKLCVDCAKQFVRNAQNCGKTNQGFCIVIRHQLIHRCLYVRFWNLDFGFCIMIRHQLIHRCLYVRFWNLGFGNTEFTRKGCKNQLCVDTCLSFLFPIPSIILPFKGRCTMGQFTIQILYLSQSPSVRSLT